MKLKLVSITYSAKALTIQQDGFPHRSVRIVVLERRCANEDGKYLSTSKYDLHLQWGGKLVDIVMSSKQP